MTRKPNLSLEYLSAKINRQQREIREIRNLLFKWGERNSLDIGDLKSKLKQLESK